jgi:hypothetical protein
VFAGPAERERSGVESDGERRPHADAPTAEQLEQAADATAKKPFQHSVDQQATV